jgi:neuroglobin
VFARHIFFNIMFKIFLMFLIFLFGFRLFEEHSELLALFTKFQELKTKEEQATSEELAEHANKVMNTLDEGIRGLDDLDTFFEFLHQTGGSHTRIPGFTAEQFWVSDIFFF